MNTMMQVPLPRTNPKLWIKPVADQWRSVVVVAGMHRSGTSLCSHMLSALGVDMTDRVPGPGHEAPAFDNPQGHWERWEIIEFHNRILAYFNRPYLSISHDFPLPVAWWADPRVAAIRREIVAFLKSRMQQDDFGFKDPRAARLMPIWKQIFVELKLAPKIIYCLRNPAQVARSIHVRDGFSLELAEYRWLSYNLEFFRYIKEYEICTIEYETWFEDPGANLKKLRTFLGLPSYQDEAELDLDLSQIIRRELRHDDLSCNEPCQPLIRSVYSLARRADQASEAREHLRSISIDFRSFQQLHCAFEFQFERNAVLAARLPEVENEATLLRAATHERDARLVAQQHQLRELELEREMLNDAVSNARRVADEKQQSIQTTRLEMAARDRRILELETQLAESTFSSKDLLECISKRLLVWFHKELCATGEVAETATGFDKSAAASYLTDEKLCELLFSGGDELFNVGAVPNLTRQIAEIRGALNRVRQSARTSENRAVEFKRTTELAEHRAKAAEHRAIAAENNAVALGNRIVALTAELASARQVGKAALQALALDNPTNIHRERRQKLGLAPLFRLPATCDSMIRLLRARRTS